MNIETIPLSQLFISFIPVAMLAVLMWHWNLAYRNLIYAMSRMLIQLLTIGYVLIYIFDTDSGLIVLGILMVMILISSWIALNTIKRHSFSLYGMALISIALGGGLTLILVSQFVLQIDPWFSPRFMIPLAGMVFANAMTSLSLAVDRLDSEISNGSTYEKARGIAFQTALIPIINSFFAVGLVSLPGMMTGQILSGISPFIAARYQIMVMCMIFSSNGIATACFLILLKRDAYFQRKLESSATTD
ncbi:MAG: ABC transporter permease [Sneathiella sp.]|nr:ABC transporter permease [Sneathiella sp.]